MVLHIKRESEGPSKIKDGTYHYALIDYPKVKEWEWNGILAFISYEKAQDEPLEIICEDRPFNNSKVSTFSYADEFQQNGIETPDDFASFKYSASNGIT